MQSPHDYHRTNGRLLYNIKQRITHAIRGKQTRIKVDMYVREYETLSMHLEGRKSVGYYRRDYWTDEDPAKLATEGYLNCTGLYDSIIFWGVPVYLRVHGLTKFDVHQRDPETGAFLFSQDTAATLNDSMTSTATKDFIKGMAKTQMSAMDTQKIIMIAMLGAGAIFGLWILGVF